MKRVVMVVIAAGLVLAPIARLVTAEACVGKTIFLGRLPGKEQEILTEILSWMVSERTGTTIQVKPYADSRGGQGAMEKAEVDLYIEDQGVAMRDILGLPVAGTPTAEVRETVRREYEQRFNFIVLKKLIRMISG